MSEANIIDSFEAEPSKDLIVGGEVGGAEFVKTAEIVEKPKGLPKDISKLTDEQKAEVGHGIQNEIVDDGRHVMARYLRIGKNLYAIAKFSLYKQLGYDTFDVWRAQPELQLPRSTSYALMKVYEVFVEKLQVKHERLTGLDWTKLYNISRLVTAENVDEMLTKVETLSRADLQRELSETRARLSGKTQAQAESHVADLDFVRECCPIGCGTTCAIIAKDEDMAVKSFKTFLGKWRSIHARIKGLFGKSKAKSNPEKKREPSKQDKSETVSPPSKDAPPPVTQDASAFEETEVLSGDGNPPAAERGQSHVPECDSNGTGGKAVHGQKADAGGEGVEAGGVAPGKNKKAIWAT